MRGSAKRVESRRQEILCSSGWLRGGRERIGLGVKNSQNGGEKGASGESCQGVGPAKLWVPSDARSMSEK